MVTEVDAVFLTKYKICTTVSVSRLKLCYFTRNARLNYTPVYFQHLSTFFLPYKCKILSFQSNENFQIVY